MAQRMPTFASSIWRLFIGLGFSERIKGSHRIFTRHGVDEILNLQHRGSLAKAYQVKQVRKIIVKYRLVECEMVPSRSPNRK